MFHISKTNKHSFEKILCYKENAYSHIWPCLLFLYAYRATAATARLLINYQDFES